MNGRGNVVLRAGEGRRVLWEVDLDGGHCTSRAGMEVILPPRYGLSRGGSFGGVWVEGDGTAGLSTGKPRRRTETEQSVSTLATTLLTVYTKVLVDARL